MTNSSVPLFARWTAGIKCQVQREFFAVDLESCQRPRGVSEGDEGNSLSGDGNVTNVLDNIDNECNLFEKRVNIGDPANQNPSAHERSPVAVETETQ